MRKVGLFLAVLFLSATGYSQIFLEVNGFAATTPQGEQVLSYSYGASNPVTIGPGGGTSAGRPSFSSFNLLMQRGKMSLALLKAVATGQRIPEAKVTIYDVTGKKAVYTITMSDVFVESFQQSAACGKEPCESPTESVSIAYKRIRINDLTHQTVVEYDLTTGTVH